MVIIEYKLSKRELEVLDLIAQGMSSTVVASVLFISTDTVKCHRHSILKGMRAFNMPQAVANAFRVGMLR